MGQSISSDKWSKLRVLISWLEQGKIIEVDGVEYGISEDGNILHLFADDRGVELPTMSHVWKLIDKIDEKQYILMNAENVILDIKRR